jgi:hypothetical protein
LSCFLASTTQKSELKTHESHMVDYSRHLLSYRFIHCKRAFPTPQSQEPCYYRIPDSFHSPYRLLGDLDVTPLCWPIAVPELLPLTTVVFRTLSGPITAAHRRFKGKRPKTPRESTTAISRLTPHRRLSVSAAVWRSASAAATRSIPMLITSFLVSYDGHAFIIAIIHN